MHLFKLQVFIKILKICNSALASSVNKANKNGFTHVKSIKFSNKFPHTPSCIFHHEELLSNSAHCFTKYAKESKVARLTTLWKKEAHINGEFKRKIFLNYI